MKAIQREGLKMLVFFALWMGAVALRAIYTEPPELLWFTGLVAAFLAAFSCGYVWARLRPARRAWRRDRRRRHFM